MLIINAPKYQGRFHQRAVDLVKSGTRVGKMHISGEATVHCHVCQGTFTPPELEQPHNDAWGECPQCKTQFVFIGVAWQPAIVSDPLLP